MSLAEYMAMKERLRYCPRCGFRIFPSEENQAILSCITHGQVFSIQQTTTGYRTEVHLED